MKIFLFFLIFSCTSFTAQIKFQTDFVVKNSPLQVKNLGTSHHNFYYKVKFSIDKESPARREAVCLLQIDNHISKFFDYNQWRQDSILQKYSHKNVLNAQEVQEILNNRVSWTNEVVREGVQVTVQDRFKDRYQYQETLPQLQWKLENETKQILDYTCNRATVEFGGRSYTAWYTKDISIPSGPYKFWGLPGLILEIADSDDHFHFEAIAVNHTPRAIYLRNDQNIFRVSKEKFKSVQLSYNENPGFFHGKALDGNGQELQPPSRKQPYNIIELE